MKPSISAKQLLHFREYGAIEFTDFPLDFEAMFQAIREAKTQRDLWRTSPLMKKILLQTIAPVAAELSGKKALRIGCDQWFDEPPSKEGRIQDLFSFQGLAAIVLLQELSRQVTILEPSSLASNIPPQSYLIAYANQNAQFIDNPKDPGAPALKRLGYAYGDFLRNDAHPLVFPSCERH